MRAFFPFPLFFFGAQYLEVMGMAGIEEIHRLAEEKRVGGRPAFIADSPPSNNAGGGGAAAPLLANVQPAQRMAVGDAGLVLRDAVNAGGGMRLAPAPA